MPDDVQLASLPLFPGDYRWRWTPAERRVWDVSADDLSTSEWCERFVRLPPSVAVLHGLWRSAVTPYAPAVMDLWDLAHVRKVIKCWAPQTTKTTTTVLPALRQLAKGRGPALFIMSNEAQLRKKFKDEYIPILQASPGFRHLLSTAKEDLTSSTIRFLGDRGRLDGAWVTSLPRLKSFGYRITLGSEVEDWPLDVEGGGDPEDLLDVRMRMAGSQGRMELESSPGKSRGIYAKACACQEVWVHLSRCPECGAEQRMTWPAKDSKWFPRWAFDPKMDPDAVLASNLAAYLCAGCGTHWTGRDRDAAVRNGRWQAVDKEFLTPEWWDHPFPEPPRVRALRPISIGSILPAWASPMVPLAKVVAEFLKAEKHPDPAERITKLKTWTNNYPAHPWLDRQPVTAAERGAILKLKDERPEGLVPSEALLLVATADVQGDGVYYELRAWGLYKTSWQVKRGFLVRSLADAIASEGEDSAVSIPRPGADFEALQAQAEAEYETASGLKLPVWFGLVDSRYRQNEVYRFCAEFCRRLVPSMGYDARQTPIAYKNIDVYPGTRKPLPGGLRRVDVDVNFWKDELSTRLALPPGSVGAWNLDATADELYAQHLTSEVKDEATGEWTQRGRQPNHWWDCGVLQLVAAKILEDQGVFRRLAGARKAAETPPPKPAPAGDRVKEKGRLW